MDDEISAVVDPAVPSAGPARRDGPARWPDLATIPCLALSGAALALAVFGGQAGSIPLSAAGYVAGSVGVPALAVLAKRRRSVERVAGLASRRTGEAAAAVPAAGSGVRGIPASISLPVLTLGLAAGTANAFLLATELAK